MDLDNTDHEYLPECTDGCGALTDWLQSKTVADQAGTNHRKETGHAWVVRVRARSELTR
ncbi:hypothetical protein [Geobacter sp. SVR]|uniref:hypothetical protein n=1 Tax=Geobacter sp. SVR TaxID=2495594 RepID=UPI00143EFACE|nr:hypothetical protein [Geobacter sp. SVR]BCS54817.1 hypothetical protein GSVR_31250 [Geobacter sp. SVR]GCF86375.1 hypothetical protein GSbR_29750 [Geobacter sp. SVR]